MVFFQNVDNVVPFHFVDVFDGNDVTINGVILNVGRDVFVVRKDPLDGALTQDLLDGPSFLVLRHMLLFLTLSLHKQVLVSTSSVVLVLNYPMKI